MGAGTAQPLMSPHIQPGVIPVSQIHVGFTHTSALLQHCPQTWLPPLLLFGLSGCSFRESDSREGGWFERPIHEMGLGQSSKRKRH